MIDLLQQGSPRLADLVSDSLWQQLVKIGRYEEYTDGQMIHSRGENKPGISIVAEGRVMVGVQGVDGTFLTTSVLGSGHCFGEFTLFAGLPRTHDISAIGNTRILQIKGGPFISLYESDPSLSRALLTVSLHRNHSLLEFLDDLRRLPLPVHVAKFVLSMSESADIENEVQCGHEALAFTFGVSRVSIGKALKKLEAQGLIALGYGRISIPEPQRLADWVAARSPVAALRASVSP